MSNRLQAIAALKESKRFEVNVEVGALTKQDAIALQIKQLSKMTDEEFDNPEECTEEEAPAKRVYQFTDAHMLAATTILCSGITTDIDTALQMTSQQLNKLRTDDQHKEFATIVKYYPSYYSYKAITHPSVQALPFMREMPDGVKQNMVAAFSNKRLRLGYQLQCIVIARQHWGIAQLFLAAHERATNMESDIAGLHDEVAKLNAKVAAQDDKISRLMQLSCTTAKVVAKAQRYEMVAGLHQNGMTQAAIAKQLGIAERTVRNDLKKAQEENLV